METSTVNGRFMVRKKNMSKISGFCFPKTSGTASGMAYRIFSMSPGDLSKGLSIFLSLSVLHATQSIIIQGRLSMKLRMLHGMSKND